MSLRLRLILWNVAVLGLVWLALALALRLGVESDIRAQIDDELAARVAAVRQRLARGGGPPALPGRFPGPGGPPFGVFAPDGTPLRPWDRDRAADVGAIQRALSTDRPVYSTVGDLRLYTLPFPHPQAQRALQAAISLEPVRREVALVTRRLLALLPVALLATALGGWFLAERALRPLRAITDAAAQIEASDLSRRLPASGRDELARLGATFNAMLSRLERAFSRQRRFVADASHEMRTPLSVIKAAAEFGRTDPATDDASRTLFARIERASDQTIALTRSLLLLARSDSERLPLERVTFALPPLVAEAIEQARALHPGGACVVTKLAVETLHGDRTLLLRLLVNLLDNALRHTPPEGDVTVAVMASGDRTAVVVADTGAGIAAEHLPHLTERFYRVDAARTRKDGGAGLGLSICQEIAQAHGGTLTIESAPGAGTTVTALISSS